MLPVTSAPAGYTEVNVFHLRSDEDLPVGLDPDAHYTYGDHERIEQVHSDVARNLCQPCHILGMALWVRDNILDDEDSMSDSADPAPGPTDAAPPATETTEPLMPGISRPITEAIAVAEDAVVLPEAAEQQMKMDLNMTVANLSQVFQSMGLPPDKALNESRSCIWRHIREMTPASMLPPMRQPKANPVQHHPAGPAASSSWY